MITSYDRSYWIGGSDTKYVIAKNKSTVTWRRWWNIKMGIDDSMFAGNIYTRMGTVYEHPILKAIDENINLDRQLIIPKYNLRVNYDGDLDGVIYEVKTHRADTEIQFHPGSAYYNQCQVEMFCWKQYLKESKVYCDYHIREHIPELKACYIVDYPLMVDEYNMLEKYEDGTPVAIDKDRIRFHKIKYDKGFISLYKPELKRLAKAIRGDEIPW